MCRALTHYVYNAIDVQCRAITPFELHDALLDIQKPINGTEKSIIGTANRVVGLLYGIFKLMTGQTKK